MSSSLQSAWSRLLLGSLVRAGLSDIVISPGSRSTPFTWAALNTPGLRCHAVPDERSAGFFALGQARISGKPSALLCTSGSAAAHYFPAVVEAAQAFVPLLVLSADRPFELMDCGAAQVMDQSKLYGGFVRRFVELGHPDASDAALDALVRMAVQALSATSGPIPGPVHVNARARKPLEPVSASDPSELALERAVSERLTRGPAQVLRQSSGAPPALETLTSQIQSAQSGLIVCGPLPASGESARAALEELARTTGFAWCAEVTSQARSTASLGSLDALCWPHDNESAPDVVLQFGTPPTASSYEPWLKRTGARRAVIHPYGWLDPTNRADWLIECEPLAFARALGAQLKAPSPALQASRRSYVSRLREREAHYWRIVADETRIATGALGEAQAVKVAIAALPSGGLLGLGNSLPLRDVDSFVEPTSAALRVWSQRGLNGIDGLVAGAAGAAHIAQCPSLLLLGDVSLLHDLGSLYSLRELSTPLVVCVLDNAGGRIFDELPIRSALAERPELTRFWRTPPELDLRHAALSFGIRFAEAEDAASLATALNAAFEHRGATLLRARVLPESARELRTRVRERFLLETQPARA